MPHHGPSLLAILFMLLFPPSLSSCTSHPATPPPPPAITLLSFDHEIWSPRMAAAHVLFQDGAQSIPCEGGALWLFGDTFMGLPAPADSTSQPAKELHPNYTGMLGATIAFLPQSSHIRGLGASMPPALAPSSISTRSVSPSYPLELTYLTGSDGKAANPFPLFPGESADLFRTWPLGGITLCGRTYIYYAMIQKTDASAPWNFKDIGGGLAFSPTPLAAYTRLTSDNNWRFPIEPFQVLHIGDVLYLLQVRGEPPLKGASLARVPTRSIEDPAAYEWFRGLASHGDPTWSREPTESAVVLPEAAGQFSVAWNQTLHAWLGVTSSDFLHPREIQFRAALNPWGPWSEPVRLPVEDKPGKATDLVYCTSIHPELSSPDGSEVVLTFCRILHGDWELSNPEVVRVHVRPSSDIISR